MGREWLYWVGGGRRRRRSQIKEEEENSSAGCMCSVFQLFDLHQFQLPLNHLHLQQQPSSFKAAGVEAPRNSLELEETEAMKAASNPLPMDKQQQQEENLNLPVGINQIKTRGGCSKSTTEDLDSPGTKTPNLVARLMGLDLLPESSSPSLNPIKLQKRCFSDDDISVGARSLPETSRTSDVDHHHRLSLQINKDRTNDEFVGKRGTRFRKQDDENSSNSPGHYARQIVKQVKESVTRRVGLLDITNTHTSTNRRDQNLLHKKTPKLDSEISPDFKQSTTPSSSPKLRFLDARKSKSVTDTGIKSPRNSSSSENSSKPKHQVIIQKVEMGKMKKLSSQKFDKGKEEAFVRSAASNKSKKKSPLSSELVHISGPTLLPIKKDPSPPATKLPLKQQQQKDQESSADSVSSKRKTQLSCNTSHSYRQLHNVVPDNTNGYATAPDYKSYVNKILKRAGIVDRFTPLTLGKWHTPSHPLDPSIFYYLELFNPAPTAVLSRRSNRKLIFQLVDELLVDILRPRFDFKHRINNDQFGLDDELCKRIGGFPAANCRVLEDIDRLVDNDLCELPLSRCYQEEEERLVCEIEGEIVEWLVCETVGLVGVRTETTCHVIRCH